MKKFLSSGLAVLALTIGICGCGYTTRGGYLNQAGYKTIYIKPFENKTNTTSEFSEGSRFKSYFPMLESTISNIIVERFNFDGSLRVSQEEKADLTLTGELIDYRRDTLRTQDDNPEEFRISLFVNIKLTDNKTGKVLWQKDGFAGNVDYFSTGSLAKSEAQAIRDAATDLARRIVETTVEAW